VSLCPSTDRPAAVLYRARSVFDGVSAIPGPAGVLVDAGVLPSASNVQLGYDIASWAQANAPRLGIMYIIYRQKIWDIRMSSGWVPMEDRGSITANHFDHVHISVF
jgi:hypothetical protein